MSNLKNIENDFLSLEGQCQIGKNSREVFLTNTNPDCSKVNQTVNKYFESLDSCQEAKEILFAAQVAERQTEGCWLFAV